MRVYYSHAMPLYGTQTERLHKVIIESHFPGCVVVDPGTYQTNPEKARRGMEYCLELVDGCHSLVFSRYMNYVTAGVGVEVNHAISSKKPVFELAKRSFNEVLGPVKHLSREETVLLYRRSSLELPPVS